MQTPLHWGRRPVTCVYPDLLRLLPAPASCLSSFAGVTFDFVALTERERISRFGHAKTSIGAFSRTLNFSTMPPKCCSCNSSGRCKNCSCKKKNLLCVNCAPCQHGRCGNHNLPGEPICASQPVPETKSILHSKNGNPFFVSGASNSDYSFFPSSSCPPLSSASATSGKIQNTVSRIRLWWVGYDARLPSLCCGLRWHACEARCHALATVTSRASAKLQLMAKLHIEKMFLLISDELILNCISWSVKKFFDVFSGMQNSQFLCIASDLCFVVQFFFRQSLFVFLVYAYRCVSCLLLFDNIFALCIMCFQALLIMF